MKLRRREFLAIAPAGALATGALGAGSALAGPCGAGRFHTAALPATSPATIGYWEGSDALEPGADPFELKADHKDELRIREGAEVPRLASALFDARALPAGDPRFLLGPARVRILGLVGGPPAAGQKFPSLDLAVRSVPGRDYRHQAWSYQNDAMRSISGPVAFTAPVDRTDGLHLSLSITSDSAEQDVALQLSLGIGAGPKLRRGLYLLSWGASVPAWHDFSLAPVEPDETDGDPVGYRLAGRGLVPARFEAPALAISIDFARTET